jgi:EAL domain-containing protein (putative c-di-GMP-specific phosphodiesterase class I)
MRDALPAGTAPTMSVNLTRKQLLDRTLVSDVREMLLDSGLDPATLTLEVTESVLMADGDAAERRIEELKGLGVRLALDDFGTGWSSLSHLNRYPLDVLKLDRSFLRDGGDDVPELAAAVVGLGAKLDLEVVAEGIELSDQWERLRALGCPLGQGMLFAPPMDADETLAHLRSQHAESS